MKRWSYHQKHLGNCNKLSLIEENLIRWWCIVQKHPLTHCLSFSVFNILHLDLPLFMEDSGYRNQGKLLTSVLTQGILLSQTDARWPPAISAWIPCHLPIYQNLKNQTENYKVKKPDFCVCGGGAFFALTYVPLNQSCYLGYNLMMCSFAKMIFFK